MRSAQKNNRSRGRGNRKSGGGGGNVVNRVFDSAGPEGKVRGTPQQVIDKYLSLARDAQTSGDRVVSENFLQHAEHYQRMLIQATAQAEQHRREHAEAGQDENGQGAGRNADEASADDRHGQPPADGDKTDHDKQHNANRGQDAIGGMTTIEPSDDQGDLLVVSEDSTPAKRRNGDGRRRRTRQSAESGSAAGDAATPETATPETATQGEG